MTLYVIIAAVSILVYLFGKIAFKMAEDLGEQKKLTEIHQQMIDSLKKQTEILAEAKTVDKVIDDLESGRF
jgi:hypothetical protein